MGGDTPVHNAKNIPEVPLGLSSLTRTIKSWQNAILLSNGTIFFPSSPNIDGSVSTQHFFPKKGKNKSKFQIANLCHGGTKDFVELWEIIQLKI